MAAGDKVFYLSMLVALLGIVGAIFGGRAGARIPPSEESWDGDAPYELAFRRARKRDGIIAIGASIIAAGLGVVIAVLSRSSVS